MLFIFTVYSLNKCNLKDAPKNTPAPTVCKLFDIFNWYFTIIVN